MLDQILDRVQRKRIERSVRAWAVALTEGWDAEAFRLAAESVLIPQDVIPDRLRGGRIARVFRGVLKGFSDEDIVAIIAEVSPPHGEVIREYPEWAQAFLGELRRMYAGS